LVQYRITTGSEIIKAEAPGVIEKSVLIILFAAMSDVWKIVCYNYKIILSLMVTSYET
jgi:hypothetical protein